MELHPLDYMRREAPRWREALARRLQPLTRPLQVLPLRQRIAAGVLAGLLLLVAITPMVCRVEESAPADAFVAFRCTSCGHEFKLSHREFERQWDAGDFRIVNGRELRCRCARCGKLEAQRVTEPE